MCRGFAIARHLIEMIGDAVDLDGRLLDCLGRAICGLCRFVRGGLRLCRRLFGVLCSLLSLCGGGFSLLSLLIVAASSERDRESKNL